MARATVLNALAVVGVLGSARNARAQEIQLTGPLHGCVAVLARYHVPATSEWSYWVSGGAATDVRRGEARVSPVAGVGAEITWQALHYRGFPAPIRWRSGFPSDDPWWHGYAFGELRVGAYALGETHGDGALVETGLTTHLGVVHDDVRNLFFSAPYGMFDVRMGAGYGRFGDDRSPHAAIALGWSYRYVSDRITWGGYCDAKPEPYAFAEATQLRLVTTLRRATAFPAWEAVVALEVSPSWVKLPWEIHERRFRPESRPRP